jgi:hypothetical protein
MLLGLALLIIGGLIYALGRLGIPLGQLPGDIRLARGNLTCFIPLASSIILSIVLTILLNLIVRYLNK